MPQIVEGKIELTGNLRVNVAGHADPARFGEPLQGFYLDFVMLTLPETETVD